MSYEDVFGFHADDSEPEEPVVPEVPPLAMSTLTNADNRPTIPVEEAQSAGGATPVPPDTVDDQPSPLLYSGFSSGKPLLIERPSRFLQRIRGGIESIVIPPDDDPYNGVDARTLCSPIMSLPYPILYGEEQFPNEDAAHYPLLYAPANHPYEDGTPIDVYALTVMLAMTATDLIHEDGGDLLAYPCPEPYTIPDSVWEESRQWVDGNARQLAALNLGRALGFAMLDPDTERDSLTTLFRCWDVRMTGDEIIGDAQEAAEQLDPVWPFPGFTPFSEH